MKYFHSLLIFFNLINLLWFKISIVKGIVGGRDAYFNQFKYHGSIRENKVHICNGAIIGKQQLLTAAHCFIDKQKRFVDVKYSVLVGVVDFNDECPSRIESDVEKIYIPRKFLYRDDGKIIENSKEDIAVIKTVSVLLMPRNPTLRRVKLPEEGSYYKTYEGEKSFVTGFGDINPVKRPKSVISNRFVEQCLHCNKLKFGDTKIIPNNFCSLKNHYSVNEEHICAQIMQRNINYPEGVCKGDSGSPLLLRDGTIIGVLSSRTPNCNERDYAAVYTKVAPLVRFIQNALADTKVSEIRTATYKTTVGLFSRNKISLMED